LKSLLVARAGWAFGFVDIHSVSALSLAAALKLLHESSVFVACSMSAIIYRNADIISFYPLKRHFPIPIPFTTYYVHVFCQA
jgi:hypothetical protein